MRRKLKKFDMINDEEKINLIFNTGRVVNWQMSNHPDARPGIVVEYWE